MEPPGKKDCRMVWVGDAMLHDVMLEQPSESTLFEDDTSHLSVDINGHSQLDVDGFITLDDLDSSKWCGNDLVEVDMLTDTDSCNKVVTTSTQTGIRNAPPGSRKIKPVKHPALKLQTPIAYQRDTDLNVIPIEKEGRAVCKKCGAIGVKHSFYTKERQYCSLACARSASENEIADESQTFNTDLYNESKLFQQNSDENFLTWNNENREASSGQQLYLTQQSQPEFSFSGHTELISELPSVFSVLPDDPVFPPDRKTCSELTYTYDWVEHLNDPTFTAVPVTCFKHAPMAECWNSISIGVKVEVENTDCYDFSEEFPDSFWIATVLRVTGYKALLRYEGFINDDSKDFWINLCSSSVHPVGWCATRGKPLIPPKTIKDKYSDWKDFLVRRLTGARTLPSNFYNKVQESLKSRFRCDLTLEVVDKERISQVKVATIEKICGKRLQLRYFDAKINYQDCFWCHEDSPLIHPVGWAKRIGQTLCAPPVYHDRTLKGLREKDDATADLFPITNNIPMPINCMFHEGMKLEAIDPLNLGDICIATVMQVLNEGYLMICVDFWNDNNSPTQDWFCYHVTSPCIFPAGFCHANDLPLTPPKGYNRTTFDWNQYLQETGCIAAPAELFLKEIPEHGFKVGMKLEAADLMNPRLVCVATISRVVGRLLKIHFDGWENDFDQWIDCNSCDIYPVGWCELVSHKLEPPYSDKMLFSGRSGKKKRARNTASHSASSKKVLKVNDNLHNKNQPTPNDVLIDQNQLTPNNALIDQNQLISNDVLIDQNHQLTPNDVLIDQNQLTSNDAVIDQNQLTSNDAVVIDQNQLTSNDPLIDQTTNSNVSSKLIPKLIDCKARSSALSGMVLCPDTWNVDDVAEFLKINDCSAYCGAFKEQEIDGKKLLELNKEDIHSLTGMKVGPSLKIQNLIHQLKLKITSSHCRLKSTIAKNCLP